MTSSQRNRLILAIDHHPDHIKTIESTLKQGNVVCDVVAIAHPHAALSYLEPHGYDVQGVQGVQGAQGAQGVRPDLILLDLETSTPQGIEAGLELLEVIKSDPELKRIPTIVLTLANDAAIVHNSYSLQGNCYILKSSNLSHLAHIVKRIEEFWLGIVTLPAQ